MKLSRDEFRDLTRSFLTEADETYDNLRLIKEVRPVSTGAWASVAEAAEPKTTDEWVDHLGQIIDQDMTSRGLTSYREEGGAIMAALEILRREIKDEMRGPTR